jgi:hypothetical protein
MNEAYSGSRSISLLASIHAPARLSASTHLASRFTLNASMPMYSAVSFGSSRKPFARIWVACSRLSLELALPEVERHVAQGLEPPALRLEALTDVLDADEAAVVT